MADVQIFYAQMCSLCHEAMDYFTENNIEFDSYEVKWQGDGWADDENSQLMRELCGDIDFVPQLIVKGKHIPGWKNLKPMIDSGALKDLLEQ